MKKIYTLLFFFFCVFGTAKELFATHAAGGELIYELVPGQTNQYKFTFKFYRDCSGVQEPNTFNMCYNNTCGVPNQSLTLTKIPGNLPNGNPNGSPVVVVGCYNAATNCQGGVLAGYREWWYTGTLTLNSTCNFWRFWVALCCRNNSVANVITPGSQNIFIEANFDNTVNNINSSPFIASPPIAYYCVNSPSTAYYNAIDVDGDSLSYESIAPQHNPNGCNNYAPVNIFSAPYTIAEPFPTGNTFVVNPVTGIITFTPTIQGAYVFSIKVKEYRNGQYIGFIMRDIQFVVSVCNLPNPLLVFATFNSVLCNGDTTTITGIATGGVPPYQYQLNAVPFQANNQFNGMGAGIYTITVMDANLCTNSSIFIISEPPPIAVNAINIVNPICSGQCTGTAQTTVTGGIPNLVYTINAPGVINVNTGAISSLCVGNYTVTVTDANGCTGTTSFSIIAPVLNVTVTNIVDVTCNGNCNGSANASSAGGANPITYSVTAPGNINPVTGSLTNLCIGTYTVTATDANGCTGTSVFTIIGPLMLIPITGLTNPVCNGDCTGTGQATATGGVNPVTYVITAPGIINANSGAMSGLCAGTYTVTATDAILCTGTTVFSILQPPALVVSVTNLLGETCAGQCNGSSQSNASGGTAPYSFSISAPGIANAVSGANTSLCSGTYTVTAIDANGCSATTTFSLNPLTQLGLNISNFSDVTCYGLCNGTAQATGSGGTPAYTYTISAPGAINPTSGAITALCAGSYTVSASDANGCTATSIFAVVQPPLLTVAVSNITNISCNGICDGTSQSTAVGGTAPYTYAISAPGVVVAATGANSSLCAGTYTVTATDANGCTATTIFTITQPLILTATVSNVTNASCNAFCNGTAQANGAGGTPTYSFSINAPGIIDINTGAITGLCAGSYTVTITDAKFCTSTTVFSISEPTVLQITNVVGTNPTCVPGNDGSITVTAIGGTPIYAYNIGGANQAGNVFNNVGSGNYTVTVTDANGCTATSIIVITPPNSPTITTLVATDVLCNGGSTGTITATATGGLGILNYNLQPTNQNNAIGIFINLIAGVYTVTVGDANGCTVSSTISILEPTILSWTLTTVINVNCNGGNDGDITVAATGGTGIINYNLQPNNVTNNTGLFPNLTAGNYTITTTDANGCTLTTAIQITEPPILSWVTTVATNVSCFGGTDGTITATATGGNGLINYNLQPTNQNNATGIFTTLIAGVYTVLATDANGCTISTTLTITEPPILQITAVATVQPTCVPGNDGSITITAIGGTPIYAYNIGGANQAGNVFNNVGSGNYTVTVTDANGCTATSIIVITPPNSPTITTLVATDVLCNGGSTGTITATATGGLGILNYNLQPTNQNNATGIFTNLIAGVYTVTVGDANGCTVSSTISILEPTILSWTLTTVINVNCNGGNDGDITVAATGGTGIINYNLQPNNVTNNTGLFPNLTAGNYTITATDANGCTLTTAIQITEPPILSWVTTVATNVSCFGGTDGTITATATGGNGLINYNLQPTNQNNATGIFTTLIAGVYTVLATDANGCTISTTLTITEPPILQITAVATVQPTCVPGNDGSITITAIGGTPIYAYNIGGANQAGNVFNNVGSGNYTVTVTDANGCTATSIIVITPPNSPTITTLVATDVLCNGGSTGTITATATGGLGILNYNIQPTNQNNATGIFTNLIAGVYTVTVGDANGCTVSSTISILEPTILSWTLTTVINVNCNGGNDGDITVAATGGTGIINYNLQPNNVTNNTGLFPNLTAGNYTITATDANGCTLTTAIQITEPPILAWVTTVATNVSCFGGTDGTITATATGGNGLINYNLQPTNQNNATGIFTTLIAGVYTVLATDANGCTISTTLTITEPPILQITAVATVQPTCVPGNDGSITITAIGGTPIYAYNIGGANQAGNVFNNVGSGNYTVTVTDANGCTATSIIVITPPNSPTITTLVATDVLCNGGSTGTITATATGGLGILNYNIQPTNQNNATGIFTNLIAGVYTVTVGDANGCTVSSTITIFEPPIIIWTITTVLNVNCNGGNDGDITVAATGGTGIINYNLQPNNVTNNTGLFPNLAAGNYTITATDANGCTLTTAIQITEPPILAWVTTLATNVSCFGGTDGTITATATGGNGLINYNLQPTNQNNGTGIFTTLIAGVYTILATDANGCTISTTLTITEPPILQITAVAPVQPTCVPGNDGTLTITATGGTPIYAYNIGGANQAGNVFNNVGSGNYTVTVTDANGCTTTSAVIVTPPNSPTITTLVATDVLCNDGTTGTITTTAAGGLGILNYNLQPTNQNNVTGIFINLIAGVYTVTVGDANGCTVSSTITIFEPPVIIWTITTVLNVNCNGGNDGDITVTATGGTGIINYNLQPNNVTNNSGLFPNLAAGNYTITATDANGCTLTTAIQITEPPILAWVTTLATNVSCFGGTDGTITATATGGNGLINYNLQPTNQNNGTGIFTTLIAGVYTILATDANGCTISTTLTITEPPILQITVVVIAQPTCVPGNDGTLTITATGGTPIFAYNIGGANQPGNVFNNVGSGNYAVTVTDANGCTATSAVIVTPPNSPTITSAVPTDASCNPANTGTVTITAFGGTGIYSYSADGINFQLGNVITGLTAGNYTITVTDAIGCTATSLVVIGTTPSPIITSVSVTDATCVPGCDGTATIFATGGNAVYTYSIDNINFLVSNIFNALCVNIYTATVVDGNGCTATSTFTISSANAPVITVNNTTDILCFGGNNGAISVTAVGAGIITYLLQPNGISNITGLFNNLTAFTYTVQATDANGCSSSTVIIITEPPILQFVNIINNSPLCTGANNGTLDVTTTGGTGIITFAINPFANFVPPATFNNLIGNTTYTITATDANGCSITSSVYIIDPQPIVITSTNTTNVTCNAGSDGNISVQAIGGTGILNYSLLPNPQNNLTGVFNNLNANTYTVTVTDANNCTLTTIIIITEPLPLIINNLTYTDITCSNLNNGTINISCTGGTGVISYNLQPLNITNTSGIFNGLVANVYTINVTDANGCSISTVLTIINPLPLLIDSVGITNVLCNGDSNASITTYASGGTGLLTYNILPQNINNNNGIFNGLPANTYTITVTDINLCITTTVITISEPLVLTIAVLNIQNILCSGAPTGQIDVAANGGTPPYTYTLLPVNLVNGTGIFTNLNAGIYTATVIDANNCTAIIEPIIITEPLPLKFDIVTKQDVKCFGDSTGSIAVSASGGTGNIVFNIVPNIGLQNPLGSFVLLTANIYTIVATDANNCTLSTVITITQNPPIVITNVLTVNLKCFGDAVGIINISAIGGIGQLIYSLNNQSPNNNGFFNQLFAGNYVANVTDSLGCSIDSLVIITQPDKIFLNTLDIFPVYCKGFSDGKITTTAGGGNGGYTYYLRPGLTINKTGYFESLHEGTYTLTVKDSLGCTFDTILAVTPPLDPLTIFITKKDLGCYGNGTEGWAQANIIGGTAPYSYLWNSSPPQFDATASGLKYGLYVVEVIDARGCKEVDSVTIDPGTCCEEVFIPNAFSPNGDGINDIFRVTTATGIELKQFEIYDRWGKKLWYTDDFREGWDGNDRGAPRDMNTYYYIFWYICLTDGETYMKKGDINLIR